MDSYFCHLTVNLCNILIPLIIYLTIEDFYFVNICGDFCKFLTLSTCDGCHVLECLSECVVVIERSLKSL